MTRLALSLLIGLVGAGIVHIVTVLAVPRFAEADLAARAEARGAAGTFVALPQPDPLLRAAICLVTLDSPVRVFAGGEVPFWSASVFTRSGVNVYSTNDRTARDGTLDIILLAASSLETLREELAEDAPELVALDGGEAVIIVRTLVPDPTFEPLAADLLGRASCNPLDMDGGPDERTES